MPAMNDDPAFARTTAYTRASPEPPAQVLVPSTPEEGEIVTPAPAAAAMGTLANAGTQMVTQGSTTPATGVSMDTARFKRLTNEPS